MCVICIKKKGVRMPSESEIKDMWERNPHGAGFMYARNGQVFIEKGFMSVNAFIEALANAGIKRNESLILHFRISTQGGINREMCHPFPVEGDYKRLQETSTVSKIGIAHNGIIQRCTIATAKYSDTAIFIHDYVTSLIRDGADIKNKALLSAIGALAPCNRFALLNGKGEISLIGQFSNIDGLIYSNTYHIKNYFEWHK